MEAVPAVGNPAAEPAPAIDVNLRHLRVIEVALDELICGNFPSRHMFLNDRKNSDGREATFYEDAANLFNRNKEYTSVIFGPDEWVHDIFNVPIVLPPPAPDKKVTAHSYKDMLMELRAKVAKVHIYLTFFSCFTILLPKITQYVSPDFVYLHGACLSGVCLVMEMVQYGATMVNSSSPATTK